MLDGSCMRCKVQFVGISAEVAECGDFDLAESAAGGAEPPDGPPRYREYWDVDEHGCAIMCFESRSTGWRVWIPCFINYFDFFGDKHTRFPYWFRPQRFAGRTVQTLADLTDDQMNERAAHIPGRITSEHQRMYDSDTFQRSYYWVWLTTSERRQTRYERKAIIENSHRRFGCEDLLCRKQHRERRT